MFNCAEISPVYPPTIDGDWRKPFYHHEIESLGKRMAQLYDGQDITDDERSWLLVYYSDLHQADRFLSGCDWTSEQIPVSEVRPHRPNIYFVPYQAGFFHRVNEYVASIEEPYEIEVI